MCYKEVGAQILPKEQNAQGTNTLAGCMSIRTDSYHCAILCTQKCRVLFALSICWWFVSTSLRGKPVFLSLQHFLGNIHKHVPMELNFESSQNE